MLGVLVGGLCFFREPLKTFWDALWPVVSDRERCREFIASFGMAAPLVFMGLQVLQVVFAPIPGEATGVIGGYLFGTLEGFFFSSLALTLGSWINFAVGRALGHRYVRKLIPGDIRDRMDFLLRHQGAVVVFILFIIPGFPKDYLSLFLGVSTLPTRAFLLLAAVGRMPGTFILSLQGASIFEGNYLLMGTLFLLCILVAFLAYRYRDSLYRWIERQNQRA